MAYNYTDTEDHVRMMQAVTYNDIEMLNRLIIMGVNVNLQNARGTTPLMLSVNYNHKEITKVLLKHGADMNTLDFSGLTPLMRCACYNHTEIAKELLKHGADIENIKANDGRTTTQCATHNRNFIIAKMIVEEAVQRHEKTKLVEKMIESIPYHAGKLAFKNSELKLPIEVHRYICEF